MFTGLIEEVGTIRRVKDNTEGKSFEIAAQKVLEDLKIGDSIAVDGTCLSVVSVLKDGFTAQAVQETIRKTTLAFFRPGSRVNLERAMAANSRFGGHFVQGHVDGIAPISSIEKKGNSAVITLEIPENLRRYIAVKGSVAINGISLTVAECAGRFVSVAVIPLTLKDTHLGLKKTGDYVNIEVDILAKYVARQLSGNSENETPLEKKITSWGYKKT
ncbi:MAG: riboflavin synthase [Candidatus Neomarinimicrobiota bacterium]|nr:MAG: riboflavin synthase [Candidatus Neomarinimicrobiota bacterium]